MERRDLEFREVFEDVTEWEDLPKEHPLEFTGYEGYDRGLESGASSTATPCSEDFLTQLVHNLSLWNVQLLYYLDEFDSLDSDLDDDTKTIVEHIYRAMDECTRLRLHSELFSSEVQRLEFLSKIACVSENIMSQLARLAAKMEQVRLSIRAYSDRPIPVKVRKVGGIYYRVRHPSRPDPEGYHRSKADRKPWNKWLNNRSHHATLIEQRIPDTGHKMLRRMEYMYRFIETSFAKIGRILGAPKGISYLARATGEDYSILTTPPVHPHIYVALNFHSDIYTQVGKDGAVRLEAIGIACAAFRKRKLTPTRSELICQAVFRS